MTVQAPSPCAHHAAQAAERLALGPAWPGGDLVFTREDGQPLHPGWFRRRFERRVARAGRATGRRWPPQPASSARRADVVAEVAQPRQVRAAGGDRSIDHQQLLCLRGTTRRRAGGRPAVRRPCASGSGGAATSTILLPCWEIRRCRVRRVRTVAGGRSYSLGVQGWWTTVRSSDRR